MAEAPTQNPVALVTSENITRRNTYTEKKPDDEKAENRSGMPEHRELDTVYHRVDLPHKQELAQRIILEAREKMNGMPEFSNNLDITKIPPLEGKLGKIEQTDKPQIFKDHVKDNQWRIYIRLNNGEPNSVVAFDANVKDGGKYTLLLESEKGVFHLTDEKSLDRARSRFTLKNTPEKKWLRGDITSQEYKAEVAKRATKKGKPATDIYKIWKQSDEDRLKGYSTRSSKEHAKLRQEAQIATERWKPGTVPEMILGIWEQEDTRKEERKKRNEAIMAGIKSKFAPVATLASTLIQNGKENVAEQAEALATRIAKRFGYKTESERKAEEEEAARQKAVAAAAARPTRRQGPQVRRRGSAKKR